MGTSETDDPGKQTAVRQVMARGWVRCTPETPLSTVAAAMEERGAEVAVVAEAAGETGADPGPAGMGFVSTETILGMVAAGRGAGDPEVGTVATRPLPCVAADDTVEHARHRLEALGAARLGVTGRDGSLVGLVDRRSLERAAAALPPPPAVTLPEGELATLYTMAPLAILLTRFEDGCILEANPATRALLGYGPEEVTGLGLADLTPAEAQAEEALQHRRLRTHGRCGPYELELLRANGEQVPVLVNGVRVEASDGEPRAWYLLQDIAERKALERELAHRATHDPLTGAFNRIPFEERIDAEMERVARYATALGFLVIDIDHFKAINDTHGHDVGDRVLVEVARRLRDIIRGSDLLARWGGEEFVVLLPETDLFGALELGERLREAIADRSFEEAGTITVSIGVAQAVPGESVRRLFSRADAALYRAKAEGRNRVLPADLVAP
ncbi:PAS domain S-box-containing protein/diguanylate cyclase (GGDEF) domain-containing protein [Thiohalospira halophila DSM 15071]|uniref:diguanylate cyclase n=1 Tax=Thiohalospira halophila DSM 15071 TaxID=1123397 RepID=A0A1I1Q1H0_9GAMM|nr:diguanylate cyclase [Thiohalospira halophila]SFD15899.1 PAS domain S-box-containing protein/diguanylate cyclase (GGDEF) domain-containing protein [Thiohalospira halophila DSM 15071]